MSPIRVGVVGVGHLGYHHARIYSLLDDAELVGVVDTSPENAAKAAGEFCPDGCFESVEGLLAAGIGSATTPDTLLYGVDQTVAGLQMMQAGIGDAGTSDTMLYGMSMIQYGLSQIKAGLASGDPNNPALLEGLVMLSEGLEAAVVGLGTPGTPDTLRYGGAQIEGGLSELGAGLGDATGGTSQMVESLMDTLVMLNVTEAELEAIHMRGVEFDHFLGRAEGAEDNQVRFVYQTKPAYNYVPGNSWLTALILSIVIGLLLLIGGILLIRAFA